MSDPSPLIFDRIRTRDVFPAPTPEPELRRFAVRYEHVQEDGETTEHVVLAQISASRAAQVEGDLAEHVREYVERVGNGFPNDGLKHRNLGAYEPIDVRPSP